MHDPVREALQEERVQQAGPVPLLTLPWELGSTGSWKGQICPASALQRWSQGFSFQCCTSILNVSTITMDIPGYLRKCVFHSDFQRDTKSRLLCNL